MRTRLVPLAVATFALLGLAPAASAAQPATAPPCRQGALIPAVSPGHNDEFDGISALAANDVWAVGVYERSDGTVIYRPLIEHWNGTAWSTVASPRPLPNLTYLGVKAISSSDAWAVGILSQTQVSQDYPVIVHWNGTAWRVAASPHLDGAMLALAAASPHDIWAVGLREKGPLGRDSTLAEHWNGHTWSAVPTPTPDKYGDILSSVTAVGPDDVWAAGERDTSEFAPAPLAEHWNGHTWSVVSMPTKGFDGTINGITSTGPDDVWAAGSYDVDSPAGTALYTLAEHWNGQAWSVRLPPSPTGDDKLNAIAAVSPSDVWAVGDTAYNQTFVLHWNGHLWRIQPGHTLSGANSVMWALSAPTATDIWAGGGAGHAESLHFCPATS